MNSVLVHHVFMPFRTRFKVTLTRCLKGYTVRCFMQRTRGNWLLGGRFLPIGSPQTFESELYARMTLNANVMDISDKEERQRDSLARRKAKNKRPKRPSGVPQTVLHPRPYPQTR